MTDTTYQNRIREYRTVSADELRRNPLNHRRHPDAQKTALRSLLSRVGRVAPLLAYEQDGALVLIDGHARLDEGGDWPVAILDVDATEAALIVAMLDKIGAGAEIDPVALLALLDTLPTEARQAAGAAWTDDELAALLGEADVIPGDGGDEFNATPEDGDTRCQAGDLWLIDGGKHRLICGDCTDPAVVARLMAGERAGGIFTSPPYDQQRTYEGNMATDWRALVSGACLLGAQHCEDAAQLFVNLGLVHRDGRVIRYWDGLIEDMETADWPLFGWYVWDKQSALPVNWHGRLAIAHEWILHFGKEQMQPTPTVPTKTAGNEITATRRRPDGTLGKVTNTSAVVRSLKVQESVIRISPFRESIDHPAVFPIELPGTFMQAYAIDIWYEPFMGSGTSIVAAHRLGRRCYGIELSPRYASVCIARAEAEGLTVQRAEP